MSIFNAVRNAVVNAVKNPKPPPFWPKGKAHGSYTAPPVVLPGDWELIGGSGNWELIGGSGNWEEIDA